MHTSGADKVKKRKEYKRVLEIFRRTFDRTNGMRKGSVTKVPEHIALLVSQGGRTEMSFFEEWPNADGDWANTKYVATNRRKIQDSGSEAEPKVIS